MLVKRILNIFLQLFVILLTDWKHFNCIMLSTSKNLQKESKKMKNKLLKTIHSTEFIALIGLVILPIISFIFIMTSPESPLYTSISRIAWVHGRWFSTFVWAALVMGAIVWLTYRMIKIGPLAERSKRIFFITQLISICLVFVGCLIFPAKANAETVKFANYMHDYLTAIAWAFYGIGLILYSVLIGRKNRFLGFMGCSIMTFVVWSSLFFLKQVIDPTSYVGASAVSEVYIINSLLIYLVVMYVLEELINKQSKTTENNNQD